MKKQILFLASLSCLIPFNATGQNKYNDLVKNQLVGPVKEVVMTRKVYGADEGYVNATRTTGFDSKGYITRSGKDTYSYDGTYTQCTCNVYPGGTTEEHYSLNKKESNNECVYSGKCTQKFDGGDGDWITTNEVINGIVFKFDESNRLLSLKQDEPTGGNLFKLLNDHCYMRKYSYRGTDALPYKVAEELDWGGDGFVYNLLISYVNIDAKGNWTHRKLYHEKTNKLLMEETRTITYYPETNKASAAQSSTQQNRIPRFTGGQAAMKKFFADNANPQKPAIATAGYGEVIVEFTVTEEGEIKDAKLKGRVSVNMDEEALRLVNMMPKWNPGIINGQPTKMKVQVGLRFLPNQAFRYIKTIVN